jgi:hypothetical protein
MRGETPAALPMEGVLNPGNCEIRTGVVTGTTDYDVIVEVGAALL